MNDQNAVEKLSALAQATRFGVFRLLIKQGSDGMPAGAIAESLGVTQNTLSTHLNILSNAGLVSARRSGRSMIYSVNITETRGLLTYLIDDCCHGHPELCDLEVRDEACC